MADIHTFTDNVLWKSSQIAATSTGDGTAIDTLGYENVVFVIHGVTASGATIDAKARSCATSGGTYADITSASIVEIPASTTSKVATIEVRTHGQLRYMKCNVTISGTATADVVALLGNPRWDGVTQDVTPIKIL